MREKTVYLRIGTILAVLFAALLLILSGCESAGAGGPDDGSDSNLGGTDGSESSGEALELPPGVITAWDLGTEEEAVIFLFDSYADIVHGYGPIRVDGYFPGMTIEPPPGEALLSWSDFQEVYCYELTVISSVGNITDDTVRFQSFCLLDVSTSMDAIICRGIADGTGTVNWIYADGTTHITAEFDDGDYSVTIDLQLTTGWNRAVFQSDDINKVVTLKTEEEPTGTVWFLE